LNPIAAPSLLRLPELFSGYLFLDVDVDQPEPEPID
jgi:hypothetical protein